MFACGRKPVRVRLVFFLGSPPDGSVDTNGAVPCMYQREGRYTYLPLGCFQRVLAAVERRLNGT